jgi:hypothetical protein
MEQIVIASVVPRTPAADELAAYGGFAVVDPRSLDDVMDLADRTSGHVLLVGERRHEVLVRRQAAALADRGNPVAWRTWPHGPGALVVLAYQAAHPRLHAATTVAYIDRLAATSWSGVWTPSVARLEDPAPSVGQHVRSWGPGAGFLVTLAGPRTGVLPVGDGDLGLTFGGACNVVCGAPERLPERARAQVLAATGAHDLEPVPAMAFDLTERVGSGKAVEIVATSTAAVDLPSPRGTCVSCGERLPSAFCPFCRTRPVASTEPQGATA